MALKYKPGVWAKRYSKLRPSERDTVNERTNEEFVRRTGVTRKLDPRRDGPLCDRWLAIRDEVIARRTQATPQAASRRQQFGASRIPVLVTAGASAVRDTFAAAIDAALEHADMPWMDIARAEEGKGVKEKAGKGTDPDVMKYLRSCPDRYETEKKAKYTERKGGEGVHWCSAFVNWCLLQVGITGSNSARALSWTDWGKELTEPTVGAIVVMKGNGWRHVAFVDKVDGQFRMLGGNQKQASGGGGSNQVSYRPYNENIVITYRWPEAST